MRVLQDYNFSTDKIDRWTNLTDEVFFHYYLLQGLQVWFRLVRFDKRLIHFTLKCLDLLQFTKWVNLSAMLRNKTYVCRGLYLCWDSSSKVIEALVTLIVILYWPGISSTFNICNNSAICSFSPIWFGRKVMNIWPCGFYLFGPLVWAFKTCLLRISYTDQIWISIHIK